VERLQAIGRWLKTNGEAIYATEAGPYLDPLPWGRVTLKNRPDGGATLYLHVWNWPAGGKILLPGIGQAPLLGRMLANGAKTAAAVTKAGLVVTLPGARSGCFRCRAPICPPGSGRGPGGDAHG
jgi:alpha-L-fucosidase